MNNNGTSHKSLMEKNHEYRKNNTHSRELVYFSWGDLRIEAMATRNLESHLILFCQDGHEVMLWLLPSGVPP
jgi:hypothetical protein